MSKRLAQISILISLSLLLSYVEAMLPNIFPLPGVKLGLANIVVLITLFLLGSKDATYVNICRVFLASLILGTFLSPSFYIGLSGAFISLAAMILSKRYTKLSIIGVSILGATFHNLGQLLAATVYIGSMQVFYYLPFLLILSIPLGALTGIIADRVLKTYNRKNLY